PADLHIAGEHHVVGAQPRARGDDAFAHACRIDRQRRRTFENPRAVAFRGGRERERVIERVDGDGVEIIDSVIVARTVQYRAHALGRPAFDLAAEIVEEPPQAQKLVAVVDLGDVEPAGLRIDAGGALFLDGIADIIEPGLGQRPQRLGALETDAGDQLFRVGGKARQDEAGIAARRIRRQPPGLQQHHRPAGPRQFARRRQPAEPAADDADVDIEVDVQRRPPRRVHHGGGVPALAIGCGLGFAHVQRLFRAAAAGRRLDSLGPESDIAAMRRLMLLRHAKTERAEGGERDRDRKLTKRGRDDAAVIGAYMARHGFIPDLALVSPAKRAEETWALLASAFAKTPRLVNDERIYNAATDALFKII